MILTKHYIHKECEMIHSSVDFVYADVYGLYDRSYVDASIYPSDFRGVFFYDLFREQLDTNGYYPQSIIGDWGGMEGWFAEHEPLFKFFEKGEFIPLSKFHDHEDLNNADVIRANAKLPADEHALFRLALYFAKLNKEALKEGITDGRYDIFTWNTIGQDKILTGFHYHDFTTTEQWTMWTGPIDRLQIKN